MKTSDEVFSEFLAGYFGQGHPISEDDYDIAYNAFNAALLFFNEELEKKKAVVGVLEGVKSFPSLSTAEWKMMYKRTAKRK